MRFKHGCWVAAGALLLAACAPDERDKSADSAIAAETDAPVSSFFWPELEAAASTSTVPVAETASVPPPAATTPPPAARPPAPVAAPPVKRPPARPNRVAAPAPAPTPPDSRAVHPNDFPDPFLFRSGAYWYAYSTQRGTTNVPVMRSVDLVHWEERGSALPYLPSWSQGGFVWAPAVIERSVGGFVLYYTTRHAGYGIQCISRAVAVLPEGPFVDTSAAPLMCQTDRGGSIDASPMRATDGWLWLVWKSEGTLEGEPTRIWSAPLTIDGEAFAGPPNELLHTEHAWEVPIIEAPSMVFAAGKYQLLYSGNRWETPGYAMGHAVCDHPAGPCRRSVNRPILASDDAKAGPGGGEIFAGPDGSWLVAYHAWPRAAVGYPAGARQLYIDRVEFDADAVRIAPRAPAPSIV